jgi:hypothetical protein
MLRRRIDWSKIGMALIAVLLFISFLVMLAEH